MFWERLPLWVPLGREREIINRLTHIYGMPDEDVTRRAMGYIDSLFDRLHSKANSLLTSSSIVAAAYVMALSNPHAFAISSPLLVVAAFATMGLAMTLIITMLLPVKWWRPEVYAHPRQLLHAKVRTLLWRSAVLHVAILLLVASGGVFLLAFRTGGW